jgi:uncharacterized protein (TIGR03435 family)
MLKHFLWMTFAACAAFGQAPAAAPAFEVASVKPSGPLNPELIKSGKMPIGLKIDAARVDIGSLSLADLIRMAYRVKQYQISGPDWMSTERFDVHAKLPDGASSEQVPEMLQALLAERFKLTIHRESKEHAMYALIVGKNGSKLKESTPDDPPSSDAPPATPGAGTGQVRLSGNIEGKGGVTVSGGPNGTMRMSMGPEGTMRMETSKMTLAQLAEVLSRFVDRPVVDMTELKGNYQVTLELSMDVLRNVAKSAGVNIPAQPSAGGDAGKSPADAASDPSGSSSIFASVQQMGLRLEARKAPIDLIVVDHLEKTPTEN